MSLLEHEDLPARIFQVISSNDIPSYKVPTKHCSIYQHNVFSEKSMKFFTGKAATSPLFSTRRDRCISVVIDNSKISFRDNKKKTV